MPDETSEEHFVVKLAKENAEKIDCMRKVIEAIVSDLGGTIDWDNCTASVPTP